MKKPLGNKLAESVREAKQQQQQQQQDDATADKTNVKPEPEIRPLPSRRVWPD